MPRWDDKADARIVRTQALGMTDAAIGAVVGCSAGSIALRLSRLRRERRMVVAPPTFWTAGDEATVVAMHAAGVSGATIARVLGVSERLRRLRLVGEVDGARDEVLRVPTADPLLPRSGVTTHERASRPAPAARGRAPSTKREGVETDH